MNVTFVYPSWMVILCVLIGVIYSVIFYRREKLFSDISNPILYLMAVLRFSVVTLLAILLLEPLIQSESQKIEKPIVVIAQDNTQSVVLNKDSLFYKNDYPDKLNQLVTALSEKYEVKTISFGEQLSDQFTYSFDERQTDMSQLFDDLYAKFYGRNLGAIIIASDGVYNKGQNPLYSSSNIKNASIYTIALGDTNQKKDVAIGNVAHNKIAYLGNDFPIEVVVNSSFYKDKKAIVSVVKDGKTITSQEISFSSDNDVLTIPFKIEATKSGKHKYEVLVSEMEDEFTLVNNKAEVFIDILDNKQQILIVYAAPHPDIGAMKLSIEKNINYKVDVLSIEDYKGKIDDYNLVILHQIPSVNGGETKLLKDIENSKQAVLFVLGAQNQFSTFNQMKTGLSIVAPKGITDAKPVLNSTFKSFTTSESQTNLFPQLPPMQIPFAGDYKLATGAQVYLYQKIGNTQTQFPLVAFNDRDGQKIGFILGEGIWRWKFQDFIKNDNNQAFDELISKMMQYLSVKEDKNKFRVNCAGEFLENENVIIQAELYNDIFELVNDVEVTLDITNEDGLDFPQKAFSKAGSAYRLDAGSFVPGNYSYVAKTVYDGQKYEVKGDFVVKELKIEFLNTVSDFSLLFNLSEKSGGKMYYKDDFQNIVNDIENNNNVASISYVNKELTDVIKWKWILFLILTLLSIEWFLRKRNGAY